MMATDQTRAPRRQTFVKAVLLVGSDWVEVSLANVSSTGLLVKFPGGMAVGTRVEIRRRGTVIVGEVAWSSSTRFGVRSREKIDESALLDAGFQSKVSESNAPIRKAWWHWRS